MTNDYRKDVLDWDEAFMATALVIARRSKDPSTQVGAVIVDADHYILSTGYNGTPKGMSDEEFPWGKDADDPLKTKYPYVIHAERNAILNTKGSIEDLRGSTVYVTLLPCNECMKSLAQAGVKRVVYYDEPKDTVTVGEATRILARMCGIPLKHYEPRHKKIELTV